MSLLCFELKFNYAKFDVSSLSLLKVMEGKPLWRISLTPPHHTPGKMRLNVTLNGSLKDMQNRAHNFKLKNKLKLTLSLGKNIALNFP